MLEEGKEKNCFFQFNSEKIDYQTGPLRACHGTCSR